MSDSQETVVQRGTSWIGVIVTAGMILLVIALLLPAVQSVRAAARRTQSRNNLKQLGLALHNYHDVFTRFPPGGVFGADGTAYHGWATFLRPYMDASPFYNRLDFNVPWDHPSNLGRFLDDWQTAFSNPTVVPDKSASGLILNHYSANQDVLYRNSSVGLNDFRRGTSHAIVLGEAMGEFEPLASPYDWRSLELGVREDSRGFGCPIRDATLVLMGDGSVHDISGFLPPAISAMLIPTTTRPVTAEDISKPSKP